MSRDMWRGYDAWRTRTPWDDEPEHCGRCPAGEDAPDLYSECGGLGECECYSNKPKWLRWAYRLKDRIKFGEEVCVVVKDPDCTCESANGEPDWDAINDANRDWAADEAQRADSRERDGV